MRPATAQPRVGKKRRTEVAMEDFKENFDSNQEALNLEIPVNGDLNGLSSTPVPHDVLHSPQAGSFTTQSIGHAWVLHSRCSVSAGHT